MWELGELAHRWAIGFHTDITRAVIQADAKECFFLSVVKFLAQTPPENMLNLHLEHLRFLRDFLRRDMWPSMSMLSNEAERMRLIQLLDCQLEDA